MRTQAWPTRPRRMLCGPIAALILLMILTAVASGCKDTTNPPSAATTGRADDDAATTPQPFGPQPGGTLKVAAEPAVNRDPAFASGRTDILINQQVYDRLTEVDPKNQVQPGLATHWQSADGRVWTFTLRSGVVFSNGEALTADDVVYTFDRLRDPQMGSPGVQLYENVRTITAVDPDHVEFTLDKPNPDFPSDVSDYHAAVLCRSVADPAAEWIGTGPFSLSAYAAEERVTLTKNPEYWRKDAQGVRLPYLDQIDLILSPDMAGQISALRGGQVQFLAGLTSELVDSIKGDNKLKVITGPSSAFHYVIHMRSDPGRPAADPRVRRALQLGTNHQELIDQVRPGLAVVGNGTPVGPAYGDYYLDQPPVYDPEQARQLLVEAGVPDLSLTLYAQQALEIPAIAIVWQQQMKTIGVTVDIQTIPPDIYYGEGDASWLRVDFGITEWGARATPNAYFNVAYVTGAAYNESQWSDPDFDTVVAQINSELDLQKRIELYRQAQTIMIERGPVIVPFFETAAAGAAGNLAGIELAPDWSRTAFATAYFER